MSETFDDFTRNGLSEVVKIDRATLGQMSAELLTLRKQVSAKSDALASYAEFYDHMAEILLGDKNPLPSTQTDNAMLEKVLALKQRVAKLEAEVASLQQRLDVACHVKAGDKVGFDWAVLDKIFRLEADLADLQQPAALGLADAATADADERAAAAVRRIEREYEEGKRR